MKVAYYPGCVAQESGKELDMAVRAVAPRLGIELAEFPNFSCCGSGFIDESNYALNTAINARNLAIAEKAGLGVVMTVCSTCQGMLKLAKWNLAHNSVLRARSDKVLSQIGMHYQGSAEPKHMLQILVEDLGGAKKLSTLVKRPLKGLKVGAFYGCHILRPHDKMGFEDPEDPHSFEDVIRALGAEPVDYRGRVMCCGFPIQFVKPKTGQLLAGKQVLDAKRHGAHAMATPCPLCHISLDTYQKEAGKQVGEELNMPVFHFPQLIGLALGIAPDALGLSRHLVDTRSALEKLGAVGVPA
ncbi:MAG: CoB--CoM heterodisulfide reductase iron-sulfur subunit B family protein [Euryarchaeota archaeon]|nr:CoB--CoM heterodisulfide reductase iron-sulfur subunit B family protein [Euryarchaeota archaeon]MDE1837730.1 CoB--CoM heterodisulfide reductase iron-sulfur subunit B family protein [Euryarchaeota archaeon]MDE1880944.1 CoB--CoM heterodisulfide reductase iron-sulfur subunit B family protein [Euryarchaeota archaeon]MDE2046107.1 CoB--CoM heterodisulfide reductase iron-sulfur subunit B family protein [Thermoplasmata archaeon]